MKLIICSIIFSLCMVYPFIYTKQECKVDQGHHTILSSNQYHLSYTTTLTYCNKKYSSIIQHGSIDIVSEFKKKHEIRYFYYHPFIESYGFTFYFLFSILAFFCSAQGIIICILYDYYPHLLHPLHYTHPHTQ